MGRTNIKLYGDKKILQQKYLKEMDENLKRKKEGWQKQNIELSRKIENLFKE